MRKFLLISFWAFFLSIFWTTVFATKDVENNSLSWIVDNYSGWNLILDYASYISSQQDDEVVWVVIWSNEKLYIWVNSPNAFFWNDFWWEWKVLIFDMGSNEFEWEFFPWWKITDMDIDDSRNRIVIWGAFWVKVLDLDLSEVWRDASWLYGDRVTISPQWYVAVLDNDDVYFYEENWQLNWKRTLWYEYTEDIDFANDWKVIYVLWFKNKNNWNPVQVSYLYAYEIDWYSLLWKSWDFDWNQLSDNMADTRLYRIKVWNDDKIYVWWESAWWNSIFRRNWKNLYTDTTVKLWRYTNPYNTSDNHITWFGVVDPNNWEVMRWQFVLTRLDSGKWNSVRIKDWFLNVDTYWNIYLWLSTAYEIEDREEKQINWQKVWSYWGDMSVYIVSNNLKDRMLWTVFSKDSWNWDITGIDVYNDRVVIWWKTSKWELFSTEDKLYWPNKPSNTYKDGYFAFWRKSYDFYEIEHWYKPKYENETDNWLDDNVDIEDDEIDNDIEKSNKKASETDDKTDKKDFKKFWDKSIIFPDEMEEEDDISKMDFSVLDELWWTELISMIYDWKNFFDLREIWEYENILNTYLDWDNDKIFKIKVKLLYKSVQDYLYQNDMRSLRMFESVFKSIDIKSLNKKQIENMIRIVTDYFESDNKISNQKYSKLVFLALWLIRNYL